MTNTKRMPKPMTSKELSQYRELKASLIVQAELILRILDPINMEDAITKVEFEMGHLDEPWIDIWHHCRSYGEDCDDYFSCPERYLGMTEDELKAEKTRLAEEEKRKRAEKAAKAKATREKRKAEKAKKEAEKKDSEKVQGMGGLRFESPNEGANMNNEELEQKIKAALPENWEFDRIVDACNVKYAACFRIKCPIEDRMGDAKLYHEKIDQICQATNSIHDGGGWAIGGSKYDNYFYVKKD